MIRVDFEHHACRSKGPSVRWRTDFLRCGGHACIEVVSVDGVDRSDVRWIRRATRCRQRVAAKESEIPTHFVRRTCVLISIAGIVGGLLAVSGIVSSVPSIPPTYAAIPGAQPSSVDYDAPAGATGEPSAPSRPTVSYRTRASCAECGVIESMRQIERAGAAVKKVRIDAAGAADDGITVSDARVDYEITIRFRDGSTTIFHEESPRGWHPGSRVIVIDGARTSID